jgi:3-mercaptopyruvate sulfurtransferase SseA
MQAFKHPEAYVLDGGLPRWLAEGYPTEEGEFSAKPKVSPTFIPVTRFLMDLDYTGEFISCTYI